MRSKYISFFIVMSFSLMFFSCSTPYSTSTNPMMMSNWKVTSIELEGDVEGMQIPAPVFDDATITCLTTSKWSLFDAGGGSYTIPPASDSSCVSGTRKISWEVVNLSKEAHYFQFYRFNAPKGILADRYTTYLMQISALTKSTMVLKYPIKYQDKTGSLVFTFVRGK